MFGPDFGLNVGRTPSQKPLALRRVGTIVPRNSDPRELRERDPRKFSVKSNARNELRLKIGKLASTIAESEMSDN